MDVDFIISDDIVSSEVYDKRDDFNFEIIFSFLDGNAFYGIYISQLIRLARACSNVTDFNNRNQFLTA